MGASVGGGDSGWVVSVVSSAMAIGDKNIEIKIKIEKTILYFFIKLSPSFLAFYKYELESIYSTCL